MDTLETYCSVQLIKGGVLVRLLRTIWLGLIGGESGPHTYLYSLAGRTISRYITSCPNSNLC